MIGSKTLERHMDALRSHGHAGMFEPAENTFRFGNNIIKHSKEVAVIPAGIGSVSGSIHAAVIEGEAPLSLVRAGPETVEGQA